MCFQKARPTRGMPFFGFGQPIENLSAHGVFLGLRERFVQGYSILFAKIIVGVTGEVFLGWHQIAILTRRLSSASALESARLLGSGTRSTPKRSWRIGR